MTGAQTNLRLSGNATEVQKSLETAFADYQAGRHHEAAIGVDRVLSRRPDEAGALHLLGAIRLAQGDFATAADVLKRASRAAPKNGDVLNMLGSSLRRLARPKEAETAYRRSIAVNPDNAEAHYNLGNLLAETSRAEEAAASYRRAIGIRPDYVAAFLGHGRAKELVGDWKRAEESYRAAIAAAPGSAQAHIALARLLDRLRRPATESFVHYQAARGIAPQDAAVLAAHGMALVRAGRLDEAFAEFESAVASDPGCVEARVNLANLLCKRGDTKTALRHYLEALEADARCVEAMIGVGNIAELEFRLDEAERIYRRALAADPGCAAAYNNLGAVLEADGRREAALSCYDRALSLVPDYADAYANLGHALKGQGRTGEALEALDRALTLAPDHADARMNRATIRLLTGDFAGGWRDYLARDAMHSVGAGVHRSPLPADLAHRRILVLADQGLGDEIFFLRFAPTLKSRGAKVFYRASPRIAAMVARSAMVDGVLGPDQAPTGQFTTVSVGDLPHILGMTQRGDIPPPLPIPPRADAMEAIAARLAALGPPPYLGVTWRAGTRIRKNGLYKEAPRAAIATALGRVPGTLIALQRQPADGEVEAFAREAGKPVHDLTPLNDSLEDMLALLALIDDYVAVSNTNIHLRAGTGRPSRVLVPHPPEFRWMEAGVESPWFPETRVYRQAADGDWAAALGALAGDLAAGGKTA